MKDEDRAKLIDERTKDVADYANRRIEELEAAFSALAKKISKVSRFYGEWRCPSPSVSKRCGPMKTNEQCAECIAKHALRQVRRNLKRRKK